MNLRAENRGGRAGRMVWRGKRAVEKEDSGHIFDMRGAQVQEIGLGRYIGTHGEGQHASPTRYTISSCGKQGATDSGTVLPRMCVCCQSGLTLRNPMDSSPAGSSVMGFSRQEYWSGLPFPSPGIEPGSPVTPAELHNCWASVCS